MPIFHYGFGFESPTQRRNNATYGWDDEDSQSVLIDAVDEAAALDWGHEISEQFIKLLHGDGQVSWRDGQFASWVEPQTDLSPGESAVSVGVFPDFATWLSPYRREG